MVRVFTICVCACVRAVARFFANIPTMNIKLKLIKEVWIDSFAIEVFGWLLLA